MPIYNIFESKESEASANTEVIVTKKEHFFSSLTARLLFFILLIADLVWAFYSFALLLMAISLYFVSFGQWKCCTKRWIALKRSAICGVSLLIALFSPALGIMIACTYFLMYDKMGIHEVVPRSLHDQFQEFIK